MPDADTAMTGAGGFGKPQAAELRAGVTEVITELTRAQGGDNMTGGRLLGPQQPFSPLGISVRGIRLPLGHAAGRLRSAGRRPGARVARR